MFPKSVDDERPEMKKLLIIMNPYAGTRQANKFLARIIDIFCSDGFDVSIAMTQGRGDATKIAKERAKDFERIIIIGGDGTFNEVVSGVLDSGAAPLLGYIPAGSTNDFATSLGLEKSVVKAAVTCTRGTPRKIDIGRFNGRAFSYVASFGAFTSASYEVPQDLKNAIGHAAYILSGIKEVVNIKPLKLEMETDDATYDGDYIFGAVCNSTSMAGIINLKPSDVDMNDGLFEVMLIKAPQNIVELNNIIFALSTQSYDTCNEISFFSTSGVKIKADAGMPWTLDGEYQEGAGEIRIENVRSAIDIMVP